MVPICLRLRLKIPAVIRGTVIPSFLDWKFFFLFFFSDFCTFVMGDGIGGSETKISTSLTGQECARECAKNDLYNGATIKANGSGGCFCEAGMTGSNASQSYMSCIFRKYIFFLPFFLCQHISSDYPTLLRQGIFVL
jgi:hypothetical protein